MESGIQYVVRNVASSALPDNGCALANYLGTLVQLTPSMGMRAVLKRKLAEMPDNQIRMHYLHEMM